MGFFRLASSRGSYDDIPPERMPAALERINRTRRRRLADRVFDVFREACIAGDLNTAETLLTLLEQMQRERQVAFPERRLDKGALVAAGDELTSRKAERRTPLAEEEAAAEENR